MANCQKWAKFDVKSSKIYSRWLDWQSAGSKGCSSIKGRPVGITIVDLDPFFDSKISIFGPFWVTQCTYMANCQKWAKFDVKSSKVYSRWLDWQYAGASSGGGVPPTPNPTTLIILHLHKRRAHHFTIVGDFCRIFVEKKYWKKNKLWTKLFAENNNILSFTNIFTPSHFFLQMVFFFKNLHWIKIIVFFFVEYKYCRKKRICRKKHVCRKNIFV